MKKLLFLIFLFSLLNTFSSFAEWQSTGGRSWYSVDSLDKLQGPSLDGKYEEYNGVYFIKSGFWNVKDESGSANRYVYLFDDEGYVVKNGSGTDNNNKTFNTDNNGRVKLSNGMPMSGNKVNSSTGKITSNSNSSSNTSLLQILKDVDAAYKTAGYYCLSGSAPLKIAGTTMNCRMDCSGFVSAFVVAVLNTLYNKNTVVELSTPTEDKVMVTSELIHSERWSMYFNSFVCNSISDLKIGTVCWYDKGTRNASGGWGGHFIIYGGLSGDTERPHKFYHWSYNDTYVADKHLTIAVTPFTADIKDFSGSGFRLDKNTGNLGNYTYSRMFTVKN